MKKNHLVNILILCSMLASLVISAAAPLPANYQTMAAGKTQQSSIKVTVENKTNNSIILRLSGPATYYFVVNTKTTEVFPVKRGTYTLTLTACGMTASASVNLNKQRRLIMPICGGNAKTAARTSASVIDLSTIVKVVKITIKNKSTDSMIVIFTGPSTYGFVLNKNETKYYTVGKGKYSVTYYACGSSASRSFTADFKSSLELSCPP